MPERVQLSRVAGWRMPPNTVKVDRSTRWGNPFKLHGDGYPMDAATAVRLFEHLLSTQGSFVTGTPGDPRTKLTTVADIQRDLRGKNLACWCSAASVCHADVLLRLANHDPANAELSGPGRR